MTSECRIEDTALLLCNIHPAIIATLLAFTVLPPCPLPSSASDPFIECESLWRAASRPIDYQQVIIKLLAIRKTIPQAKVWMADYMLGTSYCRIGYPQEGAAILGSVLREYRFADDTRKKVVNELELCAKGIPDIPRPPTLSTTMAASVHGDGGHLEEDFLAKPKLKEVSEGELSRRLFPLTDAATALAALQERVGPGFSTVATGRFVMAGQFLTSKELISLGTRLERYFEFYRSRYDMSVPDKFISIYAAGSVAQVDNWAAQLHGTILAPDIWAYSVYQDLSISAAVAGSDDDGALAHELLHLMIRGTFDDCPPWLEEGLALAYTTATISPSDISPAWNGRVRYLQGRKPRPSLQNLFMVDWRSFSVQANTLETPETDQVATIQALARCFIMYLQDRGALRDVYFAVRDKRIGPLDKPYTDDAKLVEASLHKPLAEIETDFDTWLLHKVP